MNWDAIGAIAELLGAAGVILSLLYLAGQVRQANKLTKRNAAQSLLAARGELARFVSSDAELSDLFWNGVETPDELSESEWKRFLAVASTLARNYEAIYVDQKAGLLPDAIWQAQDNSMRRWMSTPGLQKYLIKYESDYNSDFVRHVLEIREQ